MRLLRLTAASCLALLASCQGEREQWILQVRTDANIPNWGDRVLLEVLTDDGALACADCRREFVVSTATFPLTFGIVAGSNARRVRARLYQQGQITATTTDAADTDLLDFVGLLPDEVPAGPKAEHLLTVPLFAFCFGIPANLEAHTSCSFVTNASGGGEFRTNPEQVLRDDRAFDGVLQPGTVAKRRGDCPAEVPAGLVCLPGDAFLLGDRSSLGTDTDYPTTPRHFIERFYAIGVDADEMTVGTVRELVRSGQFAASREDLRVRDEAENAECTYLGRLDPAHDDLPLNCVSRDAAVDICRARGKELLTEADWEDAARGVFTSTLYPWGSDQFDCDTAVLSLPGCPRTGPLARGSAADKTARGIFNLGGNLSEWVSTPLISYRDPCWSDLEVGEFGFGSVDGCDLDYAIGWEGPWSVRGGNYASGAVRATARFASPRGEASAKIGFRCKQSLL